MQDEIRQWFLSHYRQTGKFPDYPSHLEGGSAKVFKEPPPIVIDEAEQKARERAEAEALRAAANKRKGDDSGECRVCRMKVFVCLLFVCICVVCLFVCLL